MVRWFGKSWGAAVCDPEEHIPTPVDELCGQCYAAIHPSDQGLTIPHTGDHSETTIVAYHLQCFLDSVLSSGSPRERFH